MPPGTLVTKTVVSFRQACVSHGSAIGTICGKAAADWRTIHGSEARMCTTPGYAETGGDQVRRVASGAGEALHT